MKNLILMGIPYYGNLGDHAIAVAEETIIKELFSKHKLYFLSEERLYECSKRVKKYIDKDDVIFLTGGGNMGDTYERPEKGRRRVIQEYQDNKIIIFPQTIFFSDTEKGQRELEITKQIYNSHPHLVMMAREERSYCLMKEYFPNATVYLTPDIVMALEKKSIEERKGALLIFRHDSEKVLEKSDYEKIKQIVCKKYDLVKETETNLGHLKVHNIGGRYREELLEKKFQEVQMSEIVITDRLHGMIFAAITQTPCIAFGSFNYKIAESYKWLKDLDYVQFCDNINYLEETIEKVKTVKNSYYDSSFAKNRICEILQKELC